MSLVRRKDKAGKKWEHFFACNICDREYPTSRKEYRRVSLTGYLIPDNWESRQKPISPGILEVLAICPKCQEKES